ncbi:mRNA transport regulator MTR10 [Ascoidea rubescens DSM 1968]|uniref:ARM repeat-containing protein n=1 Tax=Ascoidea rubescens DSM 1968 TaxID=1344418 RepID=A0A1D2VLJ5_9ASCO|nr:ARM repeat-containing protein [Ascoidea rubescens DSM 1968]ODV62471.1 ARM repeat-containing protein [Ascoidea rubescens DSM 1968]
MSDSHDVHLVHLKNALTTMYSNADELSKKNAFQFLENFQKSFEAWNLVNLILQNDNINAYSIETRLFAAQTLRSKIIYDLTQMAPSNASNFENLLQLKNFILTSLLFYSSPNFNSKLIRTQLNLSLINLCLQYLSWENPIDEIISFFSSNTQQLANSIPNDPNSSSNNNNNLLEFLKILPEEVSSKNKTPLTDDEFTKRSNLLITSQTDKIFTFLISSINNIQSTPSLQNTAIIQNIKLLLECLSSWIKEFPIQVILENNSIISFIFNSINIAETFEISIDCLCSILNESKDLIVYDTTTNAINTNNQPIYSLYNSILSQLQPLLFNNFDDYDIVNNLTRLFVEAAESWHILIVSDPQTFNPLIQLLLKCSTYEDLDIVKYTFYFWFLLKQTLISQKFKNSKIYFKDSYLNLIQIILKHLQYPNPDDDNDDDNTTTTTTNTTTSATATTHNNSNLSTLNNAPTSSSSKNENNNMDTRHLFDDLEQEDKFKEFRYDMGDVLKDCVLIVGTKDALSIPLQQLSDFLSSYNNSPNKSYYNWQPVEASFFALRSMAQEIHLSENTILPQIMQIAINLPKENLKIRYAITLFFGRYTEWTSRHNEYLELQLNYIINNFQSQDSQNNLPLISASSHSLMYFCQDCSKLLIPFLPNLYQFYSNVKNNIDLSSLYELTDGIAHIINKQDEIEQFENSKLFLEPILSVLNNYNLCFQSKDFSNISGVSNEKDLSIKIADEIEIISIFISLIKPKNLTADSNQISNLIIQFIWPIVKDLLNNFGSYSPVSERGLKFIKLSLQTYTTYLLPILSDIINILSIGFQKYQYGCYIWLTGVVIREFSDEYITDDIKKIVTYFAFQQSLTFFEFFSQKTSLMIPSNNFIPTLPSDKLSALVDISDNIEDFYRMLDEFLTFYPFEFIRSSEVVYKSLEVALYSLNSDKFECGAAVLHYLVDLFSWGFEYPPISYFDEVPNDIRQLIFDILMSNSNNVQQNYAFKFLTRLIFGLIYNFPLDCQPDVYDLINKLLHLSFISNKTDNRQVIYTWFTNLLDFFPEGSVSEPEKVKLLSSITNCLNSKDFRNVKNSITDFISYYIRKNVKPRTTFGNSDDGLFN